MAVTARILDPVEQSLDGRHRRDALDLARRLPAIVVAAQQTAASVSHGVHGRRQAGVGETFWQFRPFVSGESATGIDWRRSGRDDRTYVREREWEVAQTVWLWIDRSPSMAFTSDLAMQPKIDRALTLGLAAADLLVRGGEKVGLHSLTRPYASRNVVERLAEALLTAERHPDRVADLPKPVPLPGRSRAVLIGDFLAPAEAIGQTLATLASNGAVGQIVLIAVPIEDAFPLEGHVELVDTDTTARLRLGEARSLAATYLERLAAHRAAIRDHARAHGWSVLVHRTDQPAAPALLALTTALASPPRGVGA